MSRSMTQAKCTLDSWNSLKLNGILSEMSSTHGDRSCRGLPAFVEQRFNLSETRLRTAFERIEKYKRQLENLEALEQRL
jgi:hypothetical protein